MTQVYNVYAHERVRKGLFSKQDLFTTYYVEAEDEAEATKMCLTSRQTLLNVRIESDCIVTGIKGIFNKETSVGSPKMSYVNFN